MIAFQRRPSLIHQGHDNEVVKDPVETRRNHIKFFPPLQVALAEFLCPGSHSNGKPVLCLEGNRCEDCLIRNSSLF